MDAKSTISRQHALENDTPLADERSTTNEPPIASPPNAFAFKAAMRRLFGGVSVITVGDGATRTGMTVTSAIPLSIDPPTILVSVNRASSSFPVLRDERRFCVNVLDARHEGIADRFSGRSGAKGPARYEGAQWRQFATGAWGLADALAVIDCAVEEIIERHSHGIVIGRVKHIEQGVGDRALLYGRGRYQSVAFEGADGAPRGTKPPNHFTERT